MGLALFCLESLQKKNVLIDDHCNLKLTDFGLSTIHGAGASTIGTCSGGGTPRFMAPEIILKEDVQNLFGADIYAFTCVCIEVRHRTEILFDPHINYFLSCLSCAVKLLWVGVLRFIFKRLIRGEALQARPP